MSTQEFRLLWEQADGDAYPSEFAYAGPEIRISADEGRREDKQTLLQLNNSLTAAQRAAITALTRPTYTIACSGVDAGQAFDDGTHHLRIISSWDGGDFVYFATQSGIKDSSRGGSVAVMRQRFADWSRVLVSMLPASIGPGKLPVDTAVPFTQLAIGEVALPIVSKDVPRATAAAAFGLLTPSTCGSIRVTVGTPTEGRRATQLDLRYRDIPDDGRYLLICDQVGTAMPVDAATMAKMINRVVNLTKKRHEAAATR